MVVQKKASVKRDGGRTGWRGRGGGEDGVLAGKWDVEVCFWCFSASVIFKEMDAKARSIILTSGTLSPMKSFAHELAVPFQQRFEAKEHVIQPSQVLIATRACFLSSLSLPPPIPNCLPLFPNSC